MNSPPPPPPPPGMASSAFAYQYPPPGVVPYTHAYPYQPPPGPGPGLHYWSGSPPPAGPSMPVMPPYWSGYPPPVGPGMPPYQYPSGIGYPYNYPIPPPNKVNSSSFIEGAFLGKLINGTVAAALTDDLPLADSLTEALSFLFS